MSQVRETLDAINQAWRERRFDALNEFFDENIVMSGPGLKEACRGRQSAIQSYVQFKRRGSGWVAVFSTAGWSKEGCRKSGPQVAQFRAGADRIPNRWT